jgi:hypothetical protein
MATALAPLVAEFGAQVAFVDVDESSVLEARFGERVPVLTAGELELCHYHLDPLAVRTHLETIR